MSVPITYSHRQVESDVPDSWFQVLAENVTCKNFREIVQGANSI